MRRRRVTPHSFDLTITCSLCGYKIPPAEVLRTGWNMIRCPACGKDFDSMAGVKPISTS